MKKPLPRVAFGLLLALLSPAFAAGSVAALQAGFAAPPPDTRPMLRWWWYGPAVVKSQLEQEMNLMKAGGFAGFEVQPTYPLALDGQYPDLKNFKFLSPEFFDLLGFASAKAKDIGLRMDLTLGSGWPYGGPMFTRAEAAQSIRSAGSVPIVAGATTVTAPEATGRRAVPHAPVVAALLGPIADAAPGASAYLPLPLVGRDAQLPADLHGATQVQFFTYAEAGLMQVKRAAYGAEGFVVDHYSPAAIEKFIADIAQPEIAACGPNPPYSIFCDSLEVAGEGWTPDFPAEFQRRRGYDLIPLLPALFDAQFPHAAEIRGDYGRTVAEVFDDVFADRFKKLASDDHSRFRLQAYGTPPTTLSTYSHADIGEGESHDWRTLSGTRWASSANHLLGRPVTSSEAFTWLHSPVFAAAPIDLKAESNLQFLNGVNQLLCHGWPYNPPGVEYPGWRFYAAAVFNDKNPWWLVMPDITRYLAATSFMLRQGTPANDIALYLPEEDAFTEMTPTNLQMVGAGGNGLLNPHVASVIPPILDAGYNFDLIDSGILAEHGKVSGGALAFGDLSYRIVVLPNLTRISLAALQALDAFASGGGLLIATGHPPSVAPGYLASAGDQALVREITGRLFTGPAAKGIVVPVAQLGATLMRLAPPDVALHEPQPSLGFIHRHTADAEVYFLANTANLPVATSALFRVSGRKAEWWDAATGRITAATSAKAAGGSTQVAIDLPPFGAEFLVFSTPSTFGDRAPAPPGPGESSTIDLNGEWTLTFANASGEPDPAPAQVTTLASWSEQPATKYFSGVGTYEQEVDVPAAALGPNRQQELDFGSGAPVIPVGRAMGVRANFQPPIGDAAVVYVNGQRAGALWAPPYRVSITGLLHAGANQIRVAVANRAINFMADTAHHPLPDYRALNANPELGGNRFQPQDMGRIQVAPSGLLGPVRLLSGPLEN
jgi:hypothetical protein